MLERGADELGHLRHGGHAWGVDIVDARADLGVEGLVNILQQFHAGAGRLDGGDIGIEAGNGIDDLAELGVTQVGVDLGGRLGLECNEAEGAHGPVQVGLAVFLTQRQQFTQGGFIDLNDVDAGLFQVPDLIRQRDAELVRRDGLVDVIAHEGPGQDSHRTGEHALDVVLGERLGVLGPLGGHRSRAGDVTDNDWRTGAAGAIRLDPAVFGGYETIEQLGKVLDHIIALRLAVYKYIEAEALLQLDDGLDLVLEGGVVVGVGKLALAVRRTRLADFLGLWE